MADKQKHILVVEDEKPLSHALELKLTKAGYTVMVAYNGREGLDAIAANHFDAILLDLMMPVVDGFTVLEELGKHPPIPPVIVLSNLAQREDEQRSLALGARKFFVKSDTPLAVIEAAVGEILR
ncbi:MAG TPA: response regulator [Candidatus Acidoferrum sp.]|nr:response regulator [Candidatus Acidoferrum sp.]